MPTTIIAITFSIYTLILIGTLILLLKSDDSIHQKNKKILTNSVRTQGKITAIYHPKRKNKQGVNKTQEHSIVVVYEYKAKSKTKTLSGESTIYLDIRNRERQKGLYRVGDPIDLLYLKDDPALVGIANYVTPTKGDNIFVVANMIALLSSLLVLGLLAFVGLPDANNKISDALGVVFGFLMYAFLMFGSVAIAFAGIFSVKKFVQFLEIKKDRIKEKGKVLEEWKMDQSRGGVSFHIRYTYPSIAPFSIETSVTEKLSKIIQKNKVIEVCYSKTDKFSSEIVGNKNTPYGFCLFLILTPMIMLFVAWIFYESVLRIFHPI